MSTLPNREKTDMETSSPDRHRKIFLEQGYLVLRGALDPQRDIEPVADAFFRLTDDLAAWALDDENSSVVPGYKKMDFPNRFASLVGITRGGVFNHFDPTLNVYEWGYRRWPTAPPAQLPELFDLQRNAKILDALEEVIGPEIWVSSGYHINIKLAPDHLEQVRRAESAAKEAGIKQKPVVETGPFNQAFQMGETQWHMDAYPGQGSEFEHNYIIVWIPLTPSTADNGTLAVLPGSHLNGYCEFPTEREDEAVVLEAEPGDIVLMNGKMFHKSVKNRSSDSYRMAINTRYSPIGFRCGRCCLPGFVGRSLETPEKVLTDSELWRASWDEALDFIYRYEIPVPHIELSVKQVDRLQRLWKKRIPDQQSWLQLHKHGSFLKALRTRVMRGMGKVRFYLSAYLNIGRHYR